MEIAIIVVAFIAFVGFGQWLQYRRRIMIHQERLMAIEKGVELPPLEREVNRSSWNIQRILLLAGLVWISLGIGLFVGFVPFYQLTHGFQENIPQGVRWIAVAPAAIGLSHIIVYLVGRKRGN